MIEKNNTTFSVFLNLYYCETEQNYFKSIITININIPAKYLSFFKPKTKDANDKLFY